MNMHIRNRRPHRFKNIQVSLSRVIGVYTSLHTDFAGTAIPCFPTTAGYFLRTYIIRGATQVLAHLAFRKRTELTLEIAHIRVIYIAINNVGHLVARYLLAQTISGYANLVNLVSACVKESRVVAGTKLQAVCSLFEYVCKLPMRA